MQRNRKKRHIEEHEESWAVSYADLLMVLMSFFIVFFNIEGGTAEEKKDLVAKISESFKGDEGSSKGKETKKDSQADGDAKLNGLGGIESLLIKKNYSISYIDGDGNTVRTGKERGLSSLFDKKKVQEIKKIKGLLIELPDDIFGLGSYELNKETKAHIDTVLKSLTEYREKISIIAIGHSDSVPMHASRKIIKSNFILSSLRSSKAVEYIAGQGYDKNWVFGQAVSVGNRSSRSLSLKIYERDFGQGKN